MSSSLAVLLKDCPVVPVLNATSVEAALKTTEALYKGGITAVEVVLRSSAALDAIRAIRENMPSVTVGVGTLQKPEQVDSSVDAGAQFLVSPGASETLLKTMFDTKLPMIPGVITPSEVIKATELGLTELKFFPAEQAGGVGMLKAYSSVFPQVSFCPTGGVNTNNLSEYLSLKNVFAVGGTWMVSAELINNERWDDISNLSKAALQIARSC